MALTATHLRVLRWRIEIRRTLKLALPIIFGMVGQMLLGIADTAMVGHVGVLPLAACALVNTVAHVPLITGIGVLGSISVLTAQAFGANKPEDAAEWLRHGMLLAVGTGLLTAVSLTLLGGHLHHFGQPADVVAASGTYLLLFGWSLLPVLVSHGIKLFCEALNNPWPPMLILLGGVLLNVFLNWVLIFGNLGAPAMGLDGAGIATVIARSWMAVASIVYVLRSKRLARFRPRQWMVGWSWSRVRSLFRLGVPVGLQHLFEVGGFVFGALMVGWISAEAIAAHQIAITCASTTFIAALSVGFAVSIRVGHAWGAGLPGRVRRITGGGLLIALTMMAVCAVGLVFGGRTIAGWFVHSQEVIDLTARLLVVAAVFQLADGTQVVLINALRGLSDVRLPTMIAAISYWAVALPVGYFAAFHYEQGAVGIWIGLAAGLSLAALLLSWRFVVRSRD
jgi:multidrug resistance protein, MATE family